LPATGFADDLDDVLDDLMNYRNAKRAESGAEAIAAPIVNPEPGGKLARPGKSPKPEARQIKQTAKPAKASKATATKR
jgi:hypothetical protein